MESLAVRGGGVLGWDGASITPLPSAYAETVRQGLVGQAQGSDSIVRAVPPDMYTNAAWGGGVEGEGGVGSIQYPLESRTFLEGPGPGLCGAEASPHPWLRVDFLV